MNEIDKKKKIIPRDLFDKTVNIHSFFNYI